MKHPQPEANRVASVDSIVSVVSMNDITTPTSVSSVDALQSETSPNDIASTASPETVKLFEQRETFHSSELLPIVTSILCGTIFGIAFNKSRIFEPFFIIEQMSFTRFLMLKCFLSGAGTSCFMGVIAFHFYPSQFSIARCKFLSLNNVFSIVLGSLILGAGLVICGSCPGMILVQIGAGVPHSGFVLIGVLSGAMVFGLTEPIWTKLIPSTSDKTAAAFMKYIFIDEIASISPTVIGIVFGVIFYGMVVVLEVLWPWKSELNTPNAPGCNFLSCGSWPPQIGGFVVGLTQLALVSVLGNSLGASSTYICVTAQWLRCTNSGDTFTNFKSQLNRGWQIVFAFSVVFGSWIAVALNPNQTDLNVMKYPYDNVAGVGAIRAVVGGFVVIIGSMIGKGCPSGHGFSGFMLMTTAALVAVPSIFIGGIATAFVIQAIG